MAGSDTSHDSGSTALRIGLLWRGDPGAPTPAPEATRLSAIFAALAALGAAGEPVIYADEAVGALRDRLLPLDGLLVWVDPLSDGKDRSRLDPLLRELAAKGVWVSAHPDVILKMGTKEVLHRTRALGWGVETELYRGPEDFRARFPQRLAASGPRVLKQNRGNGGQGVWKVELPDPVDGAPSGASKVRVLHALRGSIPEILTLDAFMARCEAYFADGGLIVDQPFQPRLPEGMIRCYLAGPKVVGYGQQLIKALVPPPADGSEPPAPGPRIMHPPEAAPFQGLRAKMETDWIPGLQRLLGVATEDLPALWDADFLFGPRTPEGEDTYVLCEINISAVAPYPDSAAEPAARWAVERASEAGARRRSARR